MASSSSEWSESEAEGSGPEGQSEEEPETVDLAEDSGVDDADDNTNNDDGDRDDDDDKEKEQASIKTLRNASKGAAASPIKLPMVVDIRKQLGKYTTKHQKKEQFRKLKKLKKKAQKEERLRQKRERDATGDDASPRKIPKTLESLRLPDETMVEDGDVETNFALHADEYLEYFNKSYVPKVLITTCANPNLKTRLFVKELSRIIPNSEAFHRRQAVVKKMVEQAIEKGYTEIIIVNEHQKEPCSMLVSHLPEGPTAFFRLSNVKLTKHIKRDWREMTSHRPEIILNNFNTRIGVSVARMLAALFHYDPQFKGRRAVTFHNQRDYIFVRHHRYEFKSGKKVALRELGPRFTLKLRSLQHGTFDSKTGEYEFIMTDKRHKLESSRRKFHL